MIVVLLAALLFGIVPLPHTTSTPPNAPAPGVEIIAPGRIGYDETLVVTVRGLEPGERYTVTTDVVGIPHTDCIYGDDQDGIASIDGTLRIAMERRGWPDLWCTGSDYAGQVRHAAGGPVLGRFIVSA